MYLYDGTPASKFKKKNITHTNKEREAHPSLAPLFKASWKLPTNVETSNSELHADMNISFPEHSLCLSCGYTIG